VKHYEHPETAATHADQELNETRSVAPPIWQTATFRAETAEEFLDVATRVQSDRFYTRYGNPNHGQASAVIASLEGGEAALVTASGMAAMTLAVLGSLRAGDHVIAQKTHYASTLTLLRDLGARLGIRATFVDQTDAGAFASAIEPETRLIVIETPTNPTMTLTDIAAVAALARERGITTIIDNTFASPLNQRPLEHGIDIVVHSATKYLAGHSDVMAGAVIASRARIEDLWKTSLVLGATLGPFDAWLLLRGLRTVALRVPRQGVNAMALAELLERHPRVRRVHYPGLPSHPQHALARRQMLGFGGMFSFEVEGSFADADAVLSRLELGLRAASLGGVETLVVHPAAMWARAMSAEELVAAGVSPTLIRVSVGVEHIDDLTRDFTQALG
jgi:cystathionine beta-lyase/cystathionine gamma-synthase